MTGERTSVGDPKFAVCPPSLSEDSETGVGFLNAKQSSSINAPFLEPKTPSLQMPSHAQKQVSVVAYNSQHHPLHTLCTTSTIDQHSTTINPTTLVTDISKGILSTSKSALLKRSKASNLPVCASGRAYTHSLLRTGTFTEQSRPAAVQ